MKYFILSVLAGVMLFAAAHEAAAEEITVTVRGMVCSFCAQGLQETFDDNPKVVAIDVDLDAKTVTVRTKEGETVSDDEIREIVADAGYDVEKIERGKSAPGG